MTDDVTCLSPLQRFEVKRLAREIFQRYFSEFELTMEDAATNFLDHFIFLVGQEHIALTTEDLDDALEELICAEQEMEPLLPPFKIAEHKEILRRFGLFKTELLGEVGKMCRSEREEIISLEHGEARHHILKGPFA